jgi:hypothetical protein
MHALRRSFDHLDKWSNIFASTAGLIFLGTPFRERHGMSLRNMVKTIKKEHSEYQVWDEIMETFIPENSFLTETVDRFLKARVKRGSIPIKCFYEVFSSSVNKVLQINDPIKEVVS